VGERTTQEPPGWRNVWLLVGLLAFSNVMTNRVLPGFAYVPWQIGMAAVLAYVAVVVDHNHPFELGIDPRNLGSGLRWGGAAMVAVLGAYVVAAAAPATAELFQDSRVGEVSVWGMLYQAVVRIPLGTVLLEEMAFRGALVAMLVARTTLWRAVWWSSALFGLWHVLPAVGIERTNPVLEEAFGEGAGRVVAVVAAVVATAAAGYVLCFLRLRSGSLLAPVLLHTATNSTGFVVAWFVIRGT
jgi:uncharacterized protein